MRTWLLPEVGSSRNMIEGLVTSSQAIETRRFSPPEMERWPIERQVLGPRLATQQTRARTGIADSRVLDTKDAQLVHGLQRPELLRLKAHITGEAQ